MIVGIHHALITYPPGADDDARVFYGGVLGFAEIEKPDSLKDKGGFWVRAGSQDLHLGPEDGVERLATRAHLAYHVTDLAPWRARLEAHGCTLLESVPIPGYARFETRDPFGNRIEFIQSLPGDA